nr:phage/plasmid replication protein [uncultured Draconibacterium sp.]
MIDTVIYQIHDCYKYTDLFEHLKQVCADIGYISSKWNVDPNEVNITDLEFTQLRYRDSNKKKTVFRSKMFIPSSHYMVAMGYDDMKDVLEINVSIPKLIYGHNISQFVRHFNEDQTKPFNMVLQNRWSQNRDESFYRFKAFTDKFFKMFFTWKVSDSVGNQVELSIDKKDVQIARIDMCFNQIFDTKLEAREYLELQKKIKKKNLHSNMRNNRQWETSVWVQTKRYTAKIYAKGDEYAKNDRLKHNEINKRRPGSYDVDLLQSIADRTLRYEISFKAGYMSYLFKQSLFREDCKFHKRWKKLFLDVKRSKAKIERLENAISKQSKKKFGPDDYLGKNENDKKIKDMIRDSKRLKLKNKQYESLKCRNDFTDTFTIELTRNNWYALYQNLLSQTTKMFWNVTENEKLDNKITIDFNVNYKQNYVNVSDRYIFGIRLYREMYSIFRDFFNQFQIEERRDIGKIDKVVEEHNKKAREHNEFYSAHIRVGNVKRMKEYSIGAVKKIWELTRVNSWDDLVRKKLISKSTKNRYKQTFSDLGLNVNSFSALPIEASKDFEDYHLLYYRFPQLLNKNQFFR